MKISAADIFDMIFSEEDLGVASYSGGDKIHVLGVVRGKSVSAELKVKNIEVEDLK